ncbi:30S ribosomal protein S4e [Candidatus Marsarchaeota G2 archaeon ECH_B_SAG-F08]|jgi:small subunit ribosomal protein S4e|uniref:Small ribosomal subunit protein eS4 n=3 Tax=Candidatus Marsarchaeota TaxID=1978152 RepID=A0A2R6AK88_9ARCH|nr:MAG: 30S ribosomal protein S4e [Candidatus Marsarchaeota G1 archaeon BE_D]PSN88877.1 MAG: 30S ribosomal protein S4e [Candidatus Marsarchaeota G1 archaeon OSP_C]PSN97509.1 MAG: 30S ribosomal protein S4e [Candidatus Marsarchaeota G2 archaeon ECH_B_SAG-F08]
MGSMGGSRTLKRSAAPPIWPVERKSFKWVVKPSPGPHPQDQSVPVLLILRDMLGLVENTHEAKVVLNQGKFIVNGKIIKRIDFPVGIMDVVKIPDLDKTFRLLPYKNGFLLHEIGEEESKFRILRIENKTILSKNLMQLNLSAGVNLAIKLTSPQDGKNVQYKTLDSLKVDVTGKQILDHIKLEIGKLVLVFKGKNSGAWGVLTEIVPAFKKRRSLVRITLSNNRVVETILDYVIVVGKDKPLISLPSMNGE